MRRLSGLQWLIVFLTVATAVIHLALAALNWGSGLLPIMFALDGIGFILLIVLLYFTGRSGASRRTIRWILIAYTLLTIILYFVFNGSGSFSSALGLVTKGIEALLIILLLVDRASDYEEVPAVAPAPAVAYATRASTIGDLDVDTGSSDWVGRAAGAAAVVGAAGVAVAEEADESVAAEVDAPSSEGTRAAVFETAGFNAGKVDLGAMSADELRSWLIAHLKEINRLDQYERQIEYVEGIGEQWGETLRGAGMGTALAFFARCMTRKGRGEVAQETGISEKRILTWANHIDLYRIRGVGQEYADLLEQSGVDTVIELGQRNAANLYERMLEVNEAKSLVRRPPRQTDVDEWVAQAKKLPRLISY